MGNINSGDRPHDDARPLAEASRPLRFGRFRPRFDCDRESVVLQEWGAAQKALVHVFPDRHRIEIHCQVGESVVIQTIRLGYRPQRIGLRRSWECPKCQRPVAVLYRPPDAAEWLCRTCSKVIYMSSRLSDKRSLAIMQQALASDDDSERATLLRAASFAAMKAYYRLTKRQLTSR